jgi:hypothetical protein
MDYRQLWIFVEGSDDVRFIKSIVLPQLDDAFDNIRVVEYAKMKKDKLDAFLHSVNSTTHSDYIFVKDINSSPCITHKKNMICDMFGQQVANNKVMIVVKEIESWYLAGLDDAHCDSFNISRFSHTNDITKERFNAMIPKQFDSRVDFMIEVLKSYSVNVAKNKNSSFSYFASRVF